MFLKKPIKHSHIAQMFYVTKITSLRRRCTIQRKAIFFGKCTLIDELQMPNCFKNSYIRLKILLKNVCILWWLRHDYHRLQSQKLNFFSISLLSIKYLFCWNVSNKLFQTIQNKNEKFVCSDGFVILNYGNNVFASPSLIAIKCFIPWC